MAYTGTKAQTGLGTTLSMGATPTIVGEVISVKLSGRKANFEDATNMQSTAEEVIPTIPSPGEWDFELNRVSGDAGQILIEAAMDDGAAQPLQSFTVQLPKALGQTTSGDKYAFSGYVESFDWSGDTKKKVTASLKLKVTNAIIYTVGS